MSVLRPVLATCLLLGVTMAPGQTPPPAAPAAKAGMTAAGAAPTATLPMLALVGGTIVDVSAGGTSTADIRDAVVIIQGGEIVAAGPRSSTRIPTGAGVVTIAGAYVVPGLEDVFAGLNSQAQANAYLYKGVTTIVGSDEPGGRRGALLRTADPSPRIRPLGFVSGIQGMAGAPVPLTTEQILRQVELEVQEGAEVLLLHYRLEPEQVRLVVKRARELGVPTIGELGQTTYTQGIEAGIDAFVHTSRYSLELASPEMHKAVALDPFGPPRTAFYKSLAELDPDAPW